MKKLKECIDKGSNDNMHIVMPYELKVRESTAAV